MDATKIKIGDRAPQEINVVIEIPQGTAIKYEVEAQTGELKIDRLIGEADVFPYHYGFIPETLAADGDALDALVIFSAPARPETVVACRPVAVLEMEDEKGADNKIICVASNETNTVYAKIDDLGDLDLPPREKIKLFFEKYKEMEQGKWTRVREFKDKKRAWEIIEEAMLYYKEK